MSDEAPKPEAFEHGSREVRAQAQAMYGEVMHRFFRGLIALHRLRRMKLKERDAWKEEEAAKREKVINEALASALRDMGTEDKARVKAFSAELVNRDLSSNDDVIIADVLRRLKG